VKAVDGKAGVVDRGVTAARRMPWTLVSFPNFRRRTSSDPAFDAGPECVSREVRQNDAIGFEDVLERL